MTEENIINKENPIPEKNQYFDKFHRRSVFCDG